MQSLNYVLGQLKFAFCKGLVLHDPLLIPMD